MSWRKVNLGELVENFSVKAKNENGSEGLEFYGVSNENGITISKYAAEDKAEEYKIIEKGCFAYNPYRINVGSIALLNENKKGLISPAYVVFKVKPNSIKEELLLKFLKSNEGLRQIKMYGRGTVRQALRFEDLCKIELSIPDYIEQEKLWEKLNQIDIKGHKVANEITHELNLIKQLRQAFLLEAMQGKLTENWRKGNPDIEPARELLKRIKDERQRLIKEGKLKKDKTLPPIKPEEIPFDIPESWMWCRLGDVSLYSEAGKSFKCFEVPIEGDEWGVIKVSAVSWDYFNEEQNKRYSNTQPDNIYAKIEVGDFLISRANTSELVGKSVVVKRITKNLLLSDKTIRFKFSGLVLSDYLNICNNSNIARNYYALMGTGSSPSMKNITRVHMNNLLIPLPPFSEQHKILEKFTKLMSLCNQMEQSAINCQEQTEQLLQVALKEALEPKVKEVV